MFLFRFNITVLFLSTQRRYHVHFLIALHSYFVAIQPDRLNFKKIKEKHVLGIVDIFR